MRRNKIKLVISILIAVVIVLIACISIIVIGKKALDEKQVQISTLQYEIDANKQTVYVASVDIAAGETLIKNGNVMQQEIYTGLESEYYMTEDMLGGVAALDIKELQPIMANMVCSLEITEDTREYEVSVANLMTDQEEYDYIDVRIMFPTGEDYTVLSKKPIHNLIKDNCVFYSYLNEDEILRMASATIDAYTITGTYIYTTRYIEPSLQKVSTPNYVVKPEVIDLINQDPNILKYAKETLNLNARIDLEERLRGLTKETLEAVADGHELADTAKTSALLDMEYSSSDEMIVLDNATASQVNENSNSNSESAGRTVIEKTEAPTESETVSNSDFTESGSETSEGNTEE